MRGRSRPGDPARRRVAGPDGSAADAGEERVVAVDGRDREVGVVLRAAAHQGPGIRHRAFTCLAFDPTGRILLARRSPQKRLWGSHWDGTVASHPAPGQSQLDAARRRLGAELGVAPEHCADLRVTDRFEYRRRYGSDGVEWEVCTVLKVTLTGGLLDPRPSEVDGLMWVDYRDLRERPRRYRQLRLCPWFEIAAKADRP